MHWQKADLSAPKKASSSREAGQIVVEYVLLLAVAVAVGLLATRLLVKRDPNDPGLLIRAWSSIIIAIGNDPADDIDRQ